MEIFYFTRTGTCKRLAEELASHYQTTAHRIDDGQDWSGAKNFIRGGALSARKVSLPVSHATVTESQVIVVFPLWAGGLPPAVRGFLKSTGGVQVTALVSSGGSPLKDQHNFSQVYWVKGKNQVVPGELLGEV